VLPRLPSNEKNSSDHHNSYNKGPNLALFSFTECPSNSLPTIKFPKNYITSSYHRNLPKTANAIFVHQRALGVKCAIKTPLPQPPIDIDVIDDIDVDPIASCSHVNRDGLLPTDHLQDDQEAPEMHIGLVEDDYFDSQEEDFYYDDYNNDNQEEPEVWKDGDEVYLQVPP
jgi:hypothetical protein